MGELPRLKHFGWGREGEAITPAEEAALLARYAARFGVSDFAEATPPPLEAIRLAAPRLAPPASLAGCCSTGTYDRAAHTYGKSYADTLRGLLGDYADAPDVVAYPADEAADRGAGLGERRRRAGDPVRRRQQRGGRRDAARRRRAARSRSICGIWIACWRSTAPRALRASRAACSAPRWRRSCARTG